RPLQIPFYHAARGCVCCCGCGHVGNAEALSIMSTALVRASIIVESDPLRDAARGFAAIDVALEIDVLVLERPPEPLDEHVVHPAASAVHGDRDARFAERAGGGGREGR